MNPASVDYEALQQLAFGNDQTYLNLSAKEKKGKLWSKCAANQAPGELNNSAAIFT